MSEELFQEMYIELEMYEHFGVSMKLDDYPASPMQIVTAHMVQEKSNYMRDYVYDEQGYLKELDFHNIQES